MENPRGTGDWRHGVRRLMRVIAGEYGGRALRAPRGHRVRPTADRVKESLFSILGQRLEGARVLDLFAGSGALGLEALSRGASEAVFVENDPVAARVLRENIGCLGCGGRASILQAGLPGAVARISGSFDLVFLDPPYGRGLACEALKALAQGDLVAGRGLVVVEHSRRDELPEQAGPFCCIDRRRYGETELSFYERRD
jgi:16S rRNA (guanine966-N2)-methyltransferase